MTFTFVEELNMNHYTPYQVVTNYINNRKITLTEREDASQACLKHLSTLARQILRALKTSEMQELDLCMFSAVIDIGMWSEKRNVGQPELYYSEYQNLLSGPKHHFSFHEGNFYAFLDKDNLQAIFSKAKLVNDPEALKHLEDLIITVPSILSLL